MLKLRAALATALCATATLTLAQSNGRLIVTNQADQTTLIIDPNSGQTVFTIHEPVSGHDTGHEVTVSKDGKQAFVPIYGDTGVGKHGTDGHQMLVIDPATGKITNTIDFGHPVRPHLPVLNPKDGLIYVTTELDKAVTIVDPRTQKIVGQISTGAEQSHMLAISRDGRRGYTTNVAAGSVSVLNLTNRKLLKTIPVVEPTGAAVLQRISVSNDDSMIFTSDQTKPQLAVIDTKSLTVKKWIPMPGTGYGSASTPDGRWLVIALSGAHKVAVIDLKTLEVAHTIDVPASPQEVLIRPDGSEAYVSCGMSTKIAEIDTQTWTVKRLIQAGKMTDGLAWAR
jgi:DNA-binding beta-propeller fold protein YncE